MKKIILIVAAVAIFQTWDDINGFINPPPPPNYVSSYDAEVVLYSAQWCAYCQKVRELMDQHNIKYLEYDIERSSKGRAQYDRLGENGIPVLLIRGEVVKGYNPSKILELAKKI